MNGKGSALRGTSRAEMERYRAGWERIFKRPKPSRPAKSSSRKAN